MKVLFFVVVGLKIVASSTVDYDSWTGQETENVSDFSSRAEAMLNRFDGTFKVKCSDQARKKAAMFPDKRHQNAVAIINLYTQECEVTVGKNVNNFFVLLNTQIASSNCLSYFREFEALLNEAIKILSPHYGVKGGTVYRGQCDSFPNCGHYRPGRFFSTSTSPYVGFDFALGKGCFVIISNVQGLNVKWFSQYSSEEEVLIASTASYFVEKKVETTDSIYNELEKHGLVSSTVGYYYNYRKVSTLIILKQLEDETGYMSAIYKIFSVIKLW